MGNAGERRNAGKSKTKRESDRANLKVPFSDFRFVRIELLEGEKEQFRSLMESGEFTDVDVDGWLLEGYSLKHTYDPQNKTFVCSLSQPYAEHPNGGLVLTGRGRDTATALSVVAFKHFYLCEDTLWREAESRRGGSYSDIG